MFGKVDYERLFDECGSYSEMLVKTTVMGGNKARLNKFLQDKWIYSKRAFSALHAFKKTVLFVKQGVTAGEIPLKFVWYALECPKSIEELQDDLNC